MTARRISTICIIGLGYIGLPTAAVFADKGIKVVGVDIDPSIVESINEGRPHIVEPDLDVLLRKVVNAGQLRAQLEPVEADAYILAVPTPFKDGHQPDLTYVEAATRSIAPHIPAGALVILESTSPVGTTEQISRWLADLRPDLKFPHDTGESADIYIAHCPERVLPGNILREVVDNDRVIGGITPRCTQRAQSLYSVFVTGEIRPTTAATAELAKLAENSFRDVNIAFANELSTICQGLNINVWELIALANLHPRVNILRPGPGVGGHCIAVDPWFIVAADPVNSRLIKTARQVNDEKPSQVVAEVRKVAAKRSNARIACLGLSYKADVDDLRESPAVRIVEDICAAGIGDIMVVEPHIDTLPPGLEAAGAKLVGIDEAMAVADVVVLLVDHQAFVHRSRDLRRDQAVIDTRGVW